MKPCLIANRSLKGSLKRQRLLDCISCKTSPPPVVVMCNVLLIWLGRSWKDGGKEEMKEGRKEERKEEGKVKERKRKDAAAALSPKLVSLHDFPSGLLLAAGGALSFNLPSGLLLVAAPAYMISPRGCSWLLLPPCLPSWPPFLNSLLGCSSSCSCCILFLFLWRCWFAVICCLLLVPVLVFLLLWLRM